MSAITSLNSARESSLLCWERPLKGEKIVRIRTIKESEPAAKDVIIFY